MEDIRCPRFFLYPLNPQTGNSRYPVYLPFLNWRGRLFKLKGVRVHTKKTKSKKQVRYLLSKGSPLKSKQKGTLKKELKSGTVKIKKKK